MIRIEHLRKEYPNITPLEDVSVTIQDGDVISIIGPSGTGKSTLMRCINLLEKPTNGHIWIGEDEITDLKCDLGRVRQKMGMVFQSFNLFGHMTVIENIMMSPMKLLGIPKRDAYKRGMELLDMVGLSDKALNYPDELSGGQKQRVAIARTLAMDPDIILFDEPTSALDPTMVGEVQAVIKQLAGTGKTMMIVTHEMKFAKAISNRVFYMDEGGIYEDGSPEQIFDDPQKEKTRQFINRLKLLTFDIKGKQFDLEAYQTKIMEFSIKNQIPARCIMKVQLVFEELTARIIDHIDESDILVKMEYFNNKNCMSFLIEYNGDEWDVLTQGDVISFTIIKGATQSIRYRKTNNALRENAVEAIITTD